MAGGSVTRTGAALLVAIDRYRHAGLIPSLPFAVTDAQALEIHLTDPAIGGLAGESVKLLTGEAATRDEVVVGLAQWLPQAAGEGEIALIYFAGHGLVRQAGQQEKGYLLPFDADPDDLPARGIALSDLAHWIDQIAAEAVVVCLDCCQSAPGPGRPGIGDWPAALQPMIGSDSSERGRFLIASCKDGSYSSLAAADQEQRLFTRYLLKGIAGAADRDEDGKVGISELLEYVSGAVERDSREKYGRTQKPWFSIAGSSRFFISSSSTQVRRGLEKKLDLKFPKTLDEFLRSSSQNTGPIPPRAGPGSGEVGRDTPATGDESAAAMSSPMSNVENPGLVRSGQVLFDRYVVVRQLGQGGTGTVWLVRDRELDAERVLKLVALERAPDPGMRAWFGREAKILDRLNHPNAVRNYDVRIGRNVAFIAMEYVRGKSLNQVLVAGTPMPLDWVADLLEQLCSVLQAANDLGIIHRNLKPTNLMLIEGREPGSKVLKLLDFSIIQLLRWANDLPTVTGSFLGTPLYASPELIVGEKHDQRSDIYSVGLILYELLTGYRPFQGSMSTVIYKHTMTPPPSFGEMNPDVMVPGRVERLVRMCLAKDPDQRPQTPSELARMFEYAIAPAATPGPSTSLSPSGGSASSALTWVLGFLARLRRSRRL